MYWEQYGEYVYWCLPARCWAVLPWKYPCISTFLSDFFYRDVYEKKFGTGKKKAQKQKKVKKPAPIGDVSSELILEFKIWLCFILFYFCFCVILTVKII